jgi:hypothetical protein
MYTHTHAHIQLTCMHHLSHVNTLPNKNSSILRFQSFLMAKRLCMYALYACILCLSLSLSLSLSLGLTVPGTPQHFMYESAYMYVNIHGTFVCIYVHGAVFFPTHKHTHTNLKPYADITNRG